MATTLPGRQIRGVTDQANFDLEAWPTPDVGALSTDARRDYLARKKAVELCLSGASSRQIKRACGIGLKQAVRLIRERCNLPHADGRIYGFRGLVKSMRINPYTRKKPVVIDAGGRGGSGAMNSLLELDVEFRRKLDAKILRSYPKDELTEVKRPRTSLWGWFLGELRSRGYEIRGAWPFNTESLGYGALRRYVDQLLKAHPRVAARQAGGETAVRKLRAGDGVDRPVDRPFQRVEMDAHKLDGRFCVLMPDASGGGWVARVIHRLWVVVIVEVMSRAVLGYYLSMRREVSKEDVLRAIKCALSQWTPKPVTYSDKPLAEGAGLPPVLGDSFVGICWEETSVDGALAETCRTVEEKLKIVVGSKLLDPQNCYSVRRSLDDRPYIETFFRTLGSRGLQRLSNSTGPNPREKRVMAPEAVAESAQVQYEYLEELLQSLICNYNATPHSALGFRSPLQMLHYFADRGTLPDRRADVDLVQGLLTYRKLCTVHGGAAQGRAPYVNFEHARYGGPGIKDREDLVGAKVWMINHLEDDARVARCTTSSGQLVGVLRAAPPWHRLPHTLAARRAIRALEKSRRLASLGNDAILSFMRFVEQQADRKLPVHPAYLEVRRVLAEQAASFEGDDAAVRALKALAGASPLSESTEEAVSRKPPTGKASDPVKRSSRTEAEGESVRPLPAKRLAAN